MNKDTYFYCGLAGGMAAAIGTICWLIFRPYQHSIDEIVETSQQTNSNTMTTSIGYDTTVRGYRNNNPLNIRLSSNNWKGEIKPSADKSFCQFQTMAYGFRAAMVCIRTYITKHNCNTLQEIINRWAPWTDGNNPLNYAKKVMNTFPDTFPDKDTVIDYHNQNQMTKLVYAMAIVENGSEPLMTDCIQAFNLI